MDVRIDTNLAELPIWIDGKVLKQMKFATSVALYETAKEAQEAVREDLPKIFTIRTNWVAKGIRIKPGSSRGIRGSGDGLNGMSVEIGTVDPFMERQELGGEKKPFKAHSVAIPNRDPQTEIADRKKWPKALLKRVSGTFLYKRADGKEFILQREGKNRYPIKLRYSFASSVNVPARWNMRERIQNLASEKYYINFERAFKKAMETAR
ncbi:hypothetical protein [Cloacibacillus porcorum]|mgnify:FL=1|uniref:hypothetical protein n=1 Tax=Cloacibacillus porcorum TaxID=1197717 RepID=UPI002673ED31|nr:hypothetical protein [Cloacibacillus porcorum]